MGSVFAAALPHHPYDVGKCFTSIKIVDVPGIKHMLIAVQITCSFLDWSDRHYAYVAVIVCRAVCLFPIVLGLVYNSSRRFVSLLQLRGQTLPNITITFITVIAIAIISTVNPQTQTPILLMLFLIHYFHPIISTAQARPR